jgi:hypothetical protein
MYEGEEDNVERQSSNRAAVGQSRHNAPSRELPPHQIVPYMAVSGVHCGDFPQWVHFIFNHHCNP